ncbi:hypothetical protein AGMMS49545_17390 [Betaproteobacteria bacterium]|nr:hypothetical protein AGMMS49545_17390 [Betaproteobacteria bacterium]GHU46679.1 hypothetical protein AGMMS50289_20620 [Betaproteobacteria bacterium]
MIHSMTGYAARTLSDGNIHLHMELRSVNSRFLDLHFRVADDLAAFESSVREKLTRDLGRGKVECRLSFTLAEQGEGGELNPKKLAWLKAREAEIRAALPEALPLTVSDILRWPGAFTQEEGVDFTALEPAIARLTAETLDEFIASRAREGAKLALLIQGRGEQMRAIVAKVTPLIPAAQAAQSEKLRARLSDAVRDAGVNIDESRILQEVALFAARIDVDEELSRLATHLDELERILKTGGVVGKRLDFLMQEFNREANTLGSKAAVSEVTQAAMDLKLLIEQMREQVQNLE